MEFRSGFVAIVGSPNVGKSTIINQMVGEKVSIVSPKPQTTRSCVRGIYTGKDFQMILLDTPGLIQAKNMLNHSMMKQANEGLKSADAVVFVLDGVVGLKVRDKENLKKLMLKQNCPLFLVINKIDIAGAGMIDSTIELIREEGFSGKIFTVCAINNVGLVDLFAALRKSLPVGPKYYPEDMYTDSPERFIAGEIVREKALLNLSEEVPHGVGVEIEKCTQRGDRELMDIHAAIYCERKSHKGIIIGNRGSMLKKIGSDAREDLELLFGMKVYLELFVKVREDWRNSASVLKTLGYE